MFSNSNLRVGVDTTKKWTTCASFEAIVGFAQGSQAMKIPKKKYSTHPIITSSLVWIASRYVDEDLPQVG
jgi:hypothetical protein